MRATTLLLCLLLAACAGGTLPGEQPVGPGRSSASAFTPSVTAAQPGVAAHADEPPPGSSAELQQQARADCWMKVEQQKGLRGDIDKRILFVDKCVAEELKDRSKL